jgi:hypothetical protein
MTSWGERVVPRLQALGLDVTECRADGGRLVFVPDGRLMLAVDASRLEVALELPVREVAAVRARLGDAERALELASAIEALPEQFSTGAPGDAFPLPVTAASTDALRAMAERLESEQRPWWLGWSVPRVDALAHAALLDELLEDAAVALGTVLALLAWPPASTSSRPKREEGAHPRRSRRDDDTRGTRRRARARSRDRDHDHEGEVEAEPEPATDREASAAPFPRATLRTARRPGLGKRAMAGVDPKAPVEKGSRVRVLDGPFAGKVGAVQDVDGKGGARVMLGLLAVRLDVKDLVACSEGRARPLLSSSHRKPLPVRS